MKRIIPFALIAVLSLLAFSSCGECKHENSHVTSIDDNFCSVVCNECGETLTVNAHTYEGEWLPHIAPTCTDEGEEKRICVLCNTGVEYRSIPATGEHVFLDYQYNGDATCESDGTETAYCNICYQVTDTRTAPDTATGHSYIYYSYNYDATCTEGGTMTAHCDRCYYSTDTKDDPDHPATDHYFPDSAYSFNDDSTCFTDGTETAVCQNYGCEEVSTRVKVGSKLSHSYESYSYNGDATCEEDGTETASCAHGCGESHTRTAHYTALGHSYSEFVADGNATCLADGTKTKRCQNEGCDDFITQPDTGSITGHNVVDGACTVCREAMSAGLLFERRSGSNYVHYGYLDGYVVIGMEDYNVKNVVIPSTYRGLPVFLIDTEAFAGNTVIESVTVPDSVHYVTSSAFEGCTSLKSVSFGAGLYGIYKKAFAGCTSLETIDIPANVRQLGESVFAACTALKNVSISEGLVSLDRYAFDGCISLDEMTLPDSLTTISDHIFNGCTSLKRVVLGNNVTYISSGTFLDCSSLCDVTIGESVKYIYESAFKNCTSLEKIVLNDKLKSISNYAFDGCKNLIHLTIGTDLTSIDGKAFRGVRIAELCDKSGRYRATFYPTRYYEEGESTLFADGDYRYLELDGVYYLVNYLGNEANITLPADCRGEKYALGNKLFADRTDITEVRLGSGVSYVGNNAFSGCTALVSVDFGNTLTEIGEHAFSGCEALQNVTLPETLVKIGGYAFAGCKSFTEFTVPDSVTYIGYYLLEDCDRIARVTVPYVGGGAEAENISEHKSFASIFSSSSAPSSLHSVILTRAKYIPYNCFSGCQSLLFISLPETLLAIGDSAFNYCTRIVEVENKSSLNIVAGNTTHGCVAYTAKHVYGVGGTSNIFTQDGYVFFKDRLDVYTLLAYEGTDTDLSLPENVNGGVYGIADNAFNSSAITSVKIPEGVYSIGERAFYDCELLSDVTLPTTLKRIGIYAFSDTNTGTVENGVTYIGAWAIAFDGSVTDVVFREGTVGIASGTFLSARNLVSVIIPETVTVIGKSTFYRCSSLKEIVIPSGVVEIEENAFQGCSALEKVTLSSSTLIIGDYAFSGCSVLGAFDFSNVTYIGNYAFQNCKKLGAINLTTALTHLGAYAFIYCESLTEATLPSSLTEVGHGVFYNCKAITEITIPVIGTVDYANGNQVYNRFDALFSEYSYYNSLNETLKKVTLTGMQRIPDGAFEYCRYIETVILPEGIISIGERAFYNCYALKNLSLPSSVREIESLYMLGNLSNLVFHEEGGAKYLGNEDNPYVLLYKITDNTVTEFTINADTKIIADNAFDGCKSITELTIPDGVVNIGTYAFRNMTALTALNIPASVEFIGDAAFKGLTFNVTVDSDNPYYKVYSGSLYSVDGKRLVRFDYFNTDTEITIPDGVETVCSAAFSDRTWIQVVNIPKSLKSFASDAFSLYNVTAFVVDPENENYVSYNGILYNKPTTRVVAMPGNISGDIVIPEGVINLNTLFQDKYLITSITIPSSVTSLDNYAFSGCSALKKIVLGDGVKLVGSYAFQSCIKLTEIYIGKNVQMFYSYAFPYNLPAANVYIDDLAHWCNITFGSAEASPLIGGGKLFVGGELLRDLVIPEGITAIKDYAFIKLSSLRTLTIPEGVLTVGKQAFYNVGGLTDVYLPTTLTAIGNDAFYLSNGNGKLHIKDLAAYLGVTKDKSDTLAFMSELYINGELITELIIPEGVTAIPERAFEYFTMLERVVIPSSVETIGDYAFSGLCNLKSLTINGATTIGNYAFSHNVLLSEIALPEGLVSIGNSVFYYCSNLIWVSLPSTLETIGISAFAECKKLYDVQNLSSITLTVGNNISGSIDSHAKNIYTATEGESKLVRENGFVFFMGDNDENYLVAYVGSESQLVLPDTILGESYNIANNAFYGNSVIKTVVIPDGVSSIGSYAFYNYAWSGSSSSHNYLGLTKITLGKDVQYIGSYAFGGCTALVEICNNSTYITDITLGTGGYGGIANYAKYITSGTDTRITVTSDGYIFYSDGTNNYLLGYVGSSKHLTLPEGINGQSYIVYGSAFWGNKNIESLEIKSGVSEIYSYAFTYCTNLKTVSISGVQRIGSQSFSACRIEELILGEGVVNIENNAFYNASTCLGELWLPSSIQIVGDYAFAYCGVTSYNKPEGAYISTKAFYSNPVND